jgi:penicillin G amidase
VRRIWKIAVAVAFVALLIAAAGLGAVLALVGRDPGPPAHGSLSARGLGGTAQVVRDPFGVPHVEAATLADAYLALGFAHAQDRLWQMELSRRSARGRLAELFGERALAQDRLARTLGFSEAARLELPKLARETRSALEAYSAGVNAWLAEIAANRATRPFELRWLASDPERWTPEDSLAIARLRAWNLGRSLSASLLLDRLVAELGGVPSRDFFPVRPSDGSHDPLQDLLSLGRVSDELARTTGLGGPSGSLGYLVPASRSKSGKPLLANDPHVGFGAPAVFYLAHIRVGRFDLSGATWPGLPLFFTGSNRSIAWGQVALHVSVSDLYEETLDAEDPARYERGGRWQSAQVRSEAIAVRGRTPAPITVIVTEHGPLLRSVWPEEPRANSLALRWTGQAEQSGVESILRLQRCSDWDCFREALRALRAPAATFLYADATGAIGTQVAGDLPVRSIDTGLLPLAGASRYYDWRGTVDFEALPSLYGTSLPVQVVSPHPDAASFRAPVTWLWSSQGGAERVRELLARPGDFDVEDLVAIQRDTVSRRGPATLRLLLASAAPESSSAQRVRTMLLEWDGSTATDSVGASLYHVFRQRLARKLLEGLSLSKGSRALLEQAEPAPGIVLERALDRVGPEKLASSRDTALDETWSFMRTRVSANPKKWTWGEVHELRLRHAFERLGSGPLAWVGRRLGSGPFEAPGDPDSAWTMYNGDLPDDALELGPALRYAVDLGDADHALLGLAGGQSGHPGSDHYADALGDWLTGQPRPLWMHASDVSYHQKGTWELHPADP